MRKCSCCGEWKSEEEFYKNKRTPSGFSYYCKKCDCTAVRDSYKKHGEKYKTRGRARTSAPKRHKCTSKCNMRFGFCMKARNQSRREAYKKYGSPIICKTGREVHRASFARA